MWMLRFAQAFREPMFSLDSSRFSICMFLCFQQGDSRTHTHTYIYTRLCVCMILSAHSLIQYIYKMHTQKFNPWKHHTETRLMEWFDLEVFSLKRSPSLQVIELSFTFAALGVRPPNSAGSQGQLGSTKELWGLILGVTISIISISLRYWGTAR